ncbi:MAG: efflux RND transporter periplasmic adaptor subunit [Gammaproteobacteria bacterium]|nr:efflux RND transporter periplasmic adaptor subunit [Gammaproteobacteria bacterium]MCP5425622.1 efflux RND transporter periplasmic adaptor subunit [Gammaproteobacteria bacterium]
MKPNETPAGIPTETGAPPPNRRRWLMLAIALFFVSIGAGYWVWWQKVGRYAENTDDAYVAGNVVQITPRTAGTVLAIQADDTDFVHAGDPLVQLDRADAKLALEQAEAQLAQTVRQVRTLYATGKALAATIELRQADVNKAKEDLTRRQALARSGAVSSEELQHARTSLLAAEAAVATAREQFSSNRVLIENTCVARHPDVELAATRVREAWLALERTSIPAPVSGYVAKRAVQVGQRVASGAPLMAVIPLNEVWVDANFKEGQLQHMRIGQPVTLTSDIYGSAVEYHGNVVGLAAGTGAAFALLPAQNATGNWIKVVQRLPVRITLSPDELAAHPLRIGLSMQVKVDVHDQSGEPLADGRQRPQPVASTGVFDQQGQGVEQLVEHVIAANLQGEGDKDGTQVACASDMPKSARLHGDNVALNESLAKRVR